MTSFAGGALLAVPVLSAIATATNPVAVYCLCLVPLFFLSGYNALSGIVKAELYPAHVRALGVAVPYAIAMAIFGGNAETAALHFKRIGNEAGVLLGRGRDHGGRVRRGQHACGTPASTAGSGSPRPAGSDHINAGGRSPLLALAHTFGPLRFRLCHHALRLARCQVCRADMEPSTGAPRSARRPAQTRRAGVAHVREIFESLLARNTISHHRDRCGHGHAAGRAGRHGALGYVVGRITMPLPLARRATTFDGATSARRPAAARSTTCTNIPNSSQRRCN